MFKLIFRYLLPLVAILATFLVGYNYYFGTPEEQESSKQIIAKVKGLGSDVFELLASEKEKYDAGKYDDAMAKIGSSLSYMKEKASQLASGGQQFLDQLNKLEAEKQELETQLRDLKQSSAQAEGNLTGARSSSPTASTIEEIQDRINRLAKQAEQIGMSIEGS